MPILLCLWAHYHGKLLFECNPADLSFEIKKGTLKEWFSGKIVNESRWYPLLNLKDPKRSYTVFYSHEHLDKNQFCTFEYFIFTRYNDDLHSRLCKWKQIKSKYVCSLKIHLVRKILPISNPESDWVQKASATIRTKKFRRPPKCLQKAPFLHFVYWTL
jgi:hypothetical protein